MRLALLIVTLTVIRLAVAASVPLAPDEAYYWVWSHTLQGGYYDHPPMVALWIAAGCAVLGKTTLGVRVLGPLATAAASWMLFDAGRVLFPGTRAGSIAVVLLNASLLLGVGSVIMTPDTPLLVFWTAGLWAASRLAVGGSGWWWLAAGLFGGLALDSKYTALLLWVGFGLWVLLVPAMRVWVRRWHPYAGAAIGFLLFLPVLLWNAERDWVGLLKQGGRVGDWRPERAIGFLGELIGGQIGLATPIVFALCVAGLVSAARRWRQPAWGLLAALALPPVLVFLQHAIGDRVQGNWPAIIYPALALAAGAAGFSRRWIGAAAACGFVITALAYGQAVWRVIPLPPRLDPIGSRLADWDGLGAKVGALAKSKAARFVAADGYSLDAELAWYLRADVPVVGIDNRWRMTRLPEHALDGATGLLAQDSRRGPPVVAELWASVEPVATISRWAGPGGEVSIYQVRADDGVIARTLPR